MRHWKKLIIIILLIFVIVKIFNLYKDHKQQLISNNEYKGTIDSYYVEIIESDKGGGFYRTTTLYPTFKNGYKITICDHQIGRYHWVLDKISICGYLGPENGCSHMEILNNGVISWSSKNSKNEDIPIFDFSKEQIIFATRKAEEARSLIYNKEHRTWSYTIFKEKTK